MNYELLLGETDPKIFRLTDLAHQSQLEFGPEQSERNELVELIWNFFSDTPAGEFSVVRNDCLAVARAVGTRFLA